MKNGHVLSVVVVGSGLVGVVVGSVLSKYANVVIYDRELVKVDRWIRHDPPFFEPGLEGLLRESNVHFTASPRCLDTADIIILCINFSHSSLLADTLDMFHNTCGSPQRKIIVEKSTFPLNTCTQITHALLAHPTHFDILSIPEFLSQGSAIRDALCPDRVLVGCDGSESGLRARDTLIGLYANWVPREKILTQSIYSTELSKLASNALLAQRISSINSFTAICDASGANISQLTHSLSTDRRIRGEYLSPSLAFGGSCLEKDLRMLVYLCESLNLHHVARYWNSVIEMNDYQLHRFIQRVKEIVVGIESVKITVLGLAFKKDTGDLRLSPSIRVIKELLRQLPDIHFSVYDPVVTSWQIINEFDASEKVEPCQSIDEAAINTHCILLLTNWDEFYTQIDWNAIYQKINPPGWVLDGHLIVDVKQLELIGYKVYQIGH
ncbi:hypothetical protein E3P86_00956 [Wallemia ichthyophaga]|uniref:UDP-glucose 6-dehydrogenase n=1 Tax=Wallemia ichthyophaga TaxID=245174 RepID=A0A4T0JDB7_WALIC|nr:hypothetical protein E3P86_00956 [Wallemia ichthyophaga]